MTERTFKIQYNTITFNEKNPKLVSNSNLMICKMDQFPLSMAKFYQKYQTMKQQSGTTKAFSPARRRLHDRPFS